MAAITLPSQQWLQQHFLYEPETGGLWRCKTPGVPFTACSKVAFEIDGKMYLTARVIWKMQTGEEPEMVDHRDGVHTNNRWHNLRPATHSQNMMNSVRKRASSGHIGVSLRDGRYSARIGLDGRTIHLGTFDNLADAVWARMDAEVKYHGEFAVRDRPVRENK